MSNLNELKLDNTVAIVTGASSGIGRAISETLALQGAKVFMIGRSKNELEKTKDFIVLRDGKAEYKVLDISNFQEFSDYIDEVKTKEGKLNILVNNAGLNHPGPIAEGKVENWQEMFNTNVIALLVGTQSAMKAMRETKSEGFIVNISSIAAQNRETSVYGATKSAVNAICSTLRKELEEDNIRVINIMPGAVATNFARNFGPEMVKNFGKMAGIEVEILEGNKISEDQINDLHNKMSKVMCSAQDIANSVLYSVTQPINVNITELVVRPAKSLQI